MGGLALIFLAIASVFQGIDEDTDIDWNRVIADMTVGASILGINKKASKKDDAQPPP
jgi:hypothetical protein